MNNAATAKKWVEFLASRSEFSAGQALLAQFMAGEISSLCECGCNGFEFRPEISGISPLAPPSENGCLAFQLEFVTVEGEGTVEFMVFIDAEGNLAGVDVDYCGNTLPMPTNVSLVEPPHRIYGILAVTPNHSR